MLRIRKVISKLYKQLKDGDLGFYLGDVVIGNAKLVIKWCNQFLKIIQLIIRLV